MTNVEMTAIDEMMESADDEMTAIFEMKANEFDDLKVTFEMVNENDELRVIEIDVGDLTVIVEMTVMYVDVMMEMKFQLTLPVWYFG